MIKSALSIITSIQMDHMSVLGSTLEEIAIEKAGIMKPGVDVLVGPDCPVELLQVRKYQTDPCIIDLSHIIFLFITFFSYFSFSRKRQCE